MFDFFFGWRKASKCKKLLKRVQCRLKLLKSKRHAIVRQLTEDVAQLIKIGYEDIAFNRAEQLFDDENTMALYELLDNFCQFVLTNMSYIRRNKDCPNDVNEAVSSLIFASARCGDLPELRLIRKLFGERYGQRFETTALEQLPGNLVNLQVKERLSVQSVPDAVKHSLVDDIARDYCLQPEILALEYIPEQEPQVIENNEVRGADTDVRTYSSQIDESQIDVSTANDAEGKAIYIDLASTCQSSASHSQHQQNYDVISTSVSPSTGQFSSPDIMESPVHEKAAQVNNHVGLGFQHRSENPTLISTGSKEFRMITASSSESLPQFPEEMIVYLDDVEEVQSSITKDGNVQDQRIFKFRSFVLPRSEKVEDSSDVKYLDQSESWSEISSRSNHSKKFKPTGRRSKRRSVSLESSALKDIDTAMYYNKPCKKPPVHKHRHSCRTKTRLKQNRRHCHEFEHCCCKHPRYTYTTDSRGDREVIHSHQLNHKCKNFRHCQSSGTDESDTEMEWYTFTQQPRRINCDLSNAKYELVTNTNCHPEKQSKKMEAKVAEVLETKQHYVRAMTMPQERSKENQTENVLRSQSFPVQSPSHVHPNLPDYDDIAAKFQALKKEHLRSKCRAELD